MNRPNKIYLLAAVFMVVAPMSISGTATEGIKYARLAVTVLMVAAGIFFYKSPSFGATTRSYVAFIGFFTLASAWSDDIFWAFFNKGMFLMATLGGLYMAYATKTREELSGGIKLLAVTGTMAGFFLFLLYLMNPEENTSMDRLAVGGMNANTIGAAAAPMFILSFFLGLWQTTFKWRLLCFGSSILLAAVILGSGSRGAALMTIVGTLIATKPFLQKRAATLILACAIPLGLVQILAITAGIDPISMIPGLSRITEGGTTENTRSGMWLYTYRQFEKSPLMGIGWLHFGKGTANCHNAYLQVLTESGILGAAILLIFLIKLLVRTLEAKRELQGAPHPELLALPTGLLASIAIHGMVEASALLGTTSLPLLLGFSVGLMDRLPDLLHNETQATFTPKPKPAIPRLDIRSSRRDRPSIIHR